jgi:hypothetical protein
MLTPIEVVRIATYLTNELLDPSRHPAYIPDYFDYQFFGILEETAWDLEGQQEVDISQYNEYDLHLMYEQRKQEIEQLLKSMKEFE